ncbi:F0F1 ATP synthase subunit gamma [Chitinophaga silvatica]|uniref:F0F1 ATP synthase subunit gamma n=1 Tax=Chitinophaga silvatica TaxID=2282649 RepID=A0A3E1Y621_9BACT|nr:F0F1 ATP synthase subunit gamma [Chitinophaga silvatica]RFS20188.1 F0F1 ATP synthase subunit gamma [Chitinophaga silvatica]
MADTLESLQRRISSAQGLGSVVKTMKALAASNIDQYEMAVKSLQNYFETVAMSLYACFKATQYTSQEAKNTGSQTVAIVLGSDQGLVGGFNEVLVDYVQSKLRLQGGEQVFWVVGERMVSRLSESNLPVKEKFPVPNGVEGIGPLVNELLINIQSYQEQGILDSCQIFYNSPTSHIGYTPAVSQVLPFDKQWYTELYVSNWPTNRLPQIIGGLENILPALITEYLFVLLYKAIAGSLSSENASRLQAMQRAEKNIDETLDDLNQQFNRIRQGAIDAELFDLVAGFEALAPNNPQK